MDPALSHRGRYGDPRPSSLAGVALPPTRMPGRFGSRPLKHWRYVGVFGPELMLCVGSARVGPGRQSFWAVWDREAEQLHERTRLRRGGVELQHPGRVIVKDRGMQIELTLEEGPGIETVCATGDAYAWTRKQGGVRAFGEVTIDGVVREVDALSVIDDSAGYHPRHTAWSWSAGVGRAVDGQTVAWNLVAGVNDPPEDSERTVWIDGEATEAAPATFARDLSCVATSDGGMLGFAAEAVRERHENLLIVRSSYRQPFGRFAGTLPGGIPLAEGWGVMERHTAVW